VTQKNALRFRSHEEQICIDQDKCIIERVYFPLLAVLLPKWYSMIAEDQPPEYSPHLYLISGVGTSPRESVDSGNLENSTEYTALLMKVWINKIWPNLNVHCVHEDSNIFRYDENISFVQRQLVPKIDQLRDDHIKRRKQGSNSWSGGDWRQYMRVTLAYADGSPARVNAVSSALREYR